MRKMLLILTVLAALLCGCEKTLEQENPYRLKTQIVERSKEGGVQLVRSEYAYDENGWLVEIQTYFDEDWQSTRQYTLDDYGNIIRTQMDYADGTRTIVEDILTLDAQNRIVYSEGYLDGELYSTAEYGYNEAGLMTKLYINRMNVAYDHDVKSYVDRTYDRKGNLIREETRWEPYDTNNGSVQYTYQKDKLMKAEIYIGETLDAITEYTYDDTGLVQTAFARKVDGTPDSKHITTFDEYGNKLEVVAYAYSSELARFGETDEEPDSKTTNIYEQKGS